MNALKIGFLCKSTSDKRRKYAIIAQPIYVPNNGDILFCFMIVNSLSY
ncbi:hypothetical protein MARI151_60146 [Maribacter litoralis]|uniref:Uncharacterized protein n=1 Tax=Maribacter litoralis TaxID=2059726 RepID=A0A653WI32_9FLAO|nr:hypothetical protein MARI151_60146 [Maribacter litoralis]